MPKGEQRGNREAKKSKEGEGQDYCCSTFHQGLHCGGRRQGFCSSRVDLYFEHQPKFREQIVRCSKVHLA